MGRLARGPLDSQIAWWQRSPVEPLSGVHRLQPGQERRLDSRSQAEEARQENTLFGAGLLGIPILMMGGPVAGALAAVVGGLLGGSSRPK